MSTKTPWLQQERRQGATEAPAAGTGQLETVGSTGAPGNGSSAADVSTSSCQERVVSSAAP